MWSIGLALKRIFLPLQSYVSAYWWIVGQSAMRVLGRGCWLSIAFKVVETKFFVVTVNGQC